MPFGNYQSNTLIHMTIVHLNRYSLDSLLRYKGYKKYGSENAKHCVCCNHNA